RPQSLRRGRHHQDGNRRAHHRGATLARYHAGLSGHGHIHPGNLVMAAARLGDGQLAGPAAHGRARHGLRSRAFVSLVIASAVLLAAWPSRAQDYPNHTIRFIVPFGAGGPTDVFTRALAEELRKSLNQGYLLDNRPGAGTIIGTTE